MSSDGYIESRCQVFIGRAASEIDKTNKSELYVYIEQFQPMAKGVVTDKTSTKPVGVVNVASTGISVAKINLTDTVLATYLGSDTNRSIPDVVPGEQVLLYYFGGDEWYWFPLQLDDALRKVEHIRWSVADKPKRMEKLTDDNTYFIEIETKYNGKRHVLISTSDSNGEVFRYRIKIDTVKGTFRIWDTKKEEVWNEIFIDSAIPRIFMKNHDKSSIDIIKQDIKMIAPNNIEMTAGNAIIMKAKNLIDTTTQTQTHTAAKTCKMTTPKLAVNAATTTVTGTKLAVNMVNQAFTGAKFSHTAANVAFTCLFTVKGIQQNTGPLIGSVVTTAIP